MSKTPNKQQRQLLLTLLEAYPDIARGVARITKEHLKRFWREAEKELNSAGPPIKNATEWKRVWVNQKKYVRQKAAQNLKSQKGTGGGPNTQHTLSAIEKGIYKLTNIKKSVEVVAAKSIGIDIDNSDTDTDTITDNSDTDNDLPVPVEENVYAGCSKSSVPKKCSPSGALEEELRMQKELGGTVKKVPQDSKKQRHSTRKGYGPLERLYDLQKNHYTIIWDLKRKKLKEMKRHHLSMEKITLREVEDTV